MPKRYSGGERLIGGFMIAGFCGTVLIGLLFGGSLEQLNADTNELDHAVETNQPIDVIVADQLQADQDLDTTRHLGIAFAAMLGADALLVTAYVGNDDAGNN